MVTVLFVCFSAEDAVANQPTFSDSSAPASVCLEGNGHLIKKQEVQSYRSVVIRSFGNENSIENESLPSASSVKLHGGFWQKFNTNVSFVCVLTEMLRAC